MPRTEREANRDAAWADEFDLETKRQNERADDPTLTEKQRAQARIDADACTRQAERLREGW